MNPDFIELLRALFAADARFLIVGAYAVSLHARPRSTGDLDLWVEPSPANAPRVYAALQQFGAPLDDLKPTDLEQSDLVFQIGVPPRRIDLLTSLTGLDGFEAAWASRQTVEVEGLTVPVIGRAELIRNKRALGRPRDLADLELLGE